MTIQANRRALPAIAVVLACVGVGAKGAEWESEAAVAAGIDVTDNVCLSSVDEESDVIATVTPSGQISGVGRRSSLDLWVSVAFNSLDEDSLDCQGASGGVGADVVSPAPRLRFNSNSELIDQWLFFDAGAFADQNRVDAFRAGGGSNLNGSGNINTTYAYSLNPYVNHRFDQEIEFYLGYIFDEQKNSEDEVRDSTGNRVNLRVNRLASAGRFTPGVTYNYYNVNYDANESFSEDENQLEDAKLTATYQFGRVWQLNGYLGKDWNDFTDTFDEADEIFWDLGFVWTPMERLTVGAGYGERFFGSTPRFNIDYRHRRSSLMLDYLRDLTYDRDFRSQDASFQSADDVAANARPDGSNGGDFAGIPTTNTTAPILSETLQLAYSFTARRSSIRLLASVSEQTRAEDLGNSTFTNAGIQFNRTISRYTSVGAGLDWYEREEGDRSLGLDPLPGASRDSETWQFSVNMNHQLSQKFSTEVRYMYRDRTADNAIEDYTENRLSLNLQYQL
jgi:uncharacterized protein (PEP-CTERM system associated)